MIYSWFTYCFFLLIWIIVHVHGRAEIFTEQNITWFDAYHKCIEKGGNLAEMNDLSTELTKLNSSNRSRIWLGEYQSYVWLKHLGCYNASSNTSRPDNIDMCIQQCNTPYIGFRLRDNLCNCLNITGSIQPTPYSRCNTNNDNNVVDFFEVLDLSGTINMADDGDCVRRPCNNDKFYQTKCHINLPAFCEEQSCTQQGFQNYTEMVNVCKGLPSFISSNKRCINKCSSNESEVWVGITRHIKNHTVNNEDYKLNNNKTDGFANCSYLIFDRNGKRLSSNRCDETNSQYGCIFSKTPSLTITSDRNVTSTTEVIINNQRSSSNQADNIDGTTNEVSNKEREITTIRSTVIIRTTNTWSFPHSNVGMFQTSPLVNLSDNLLNEPIDIKDTSSGTTNAGLISGISVAVVCLCIIVVGSLIFIRRKKGTKRDKELKSNNEDVYKFSAGRQNLHCAIQNNNVYGLAQGNCDNILEISDEGEIKHVEVSGQEYAVVYNRNPIKSIEHRKEDEYDRLCHNKTKKDDTGSNNVYDSMLGMRNEEDPTYHTTVHRETSSTSEAGVYDLRGEEDSTYHSAVH